MKKNRSTIQTLAELTAKPGKKLTTVGIIVNATKPFKTTNSEDYVTKLKVIDQTLNCNTLLEKREDAPALRKYLHVFVYSKTLELAPTPKNIGDIIYLKRYDFSFYEFTGKAEQELKCLNRQYYSRYYVFNGYCDSTQTEVEVQQKCSVEDYEPNDILVDKIVNLRLFAREYFSKHSLQDMYLQGSTDIDQTRQQHSDFDMVLKVVETTPTDQSPVVTLSLADSQGHTFFAQYLDFHFQRGDIVVVRSVNHIDYQRKLILNQYSSVIRLPIYFKDVVHFDTLFNYSLQYSQSYKHIMADQVHYDDSGQADRHQAQQYGLHSLTKLKHHSSPLSTFKELHAASLKKNIQDGPMRLRCQIYQLHTQTLREALKNYCRICNTVSEFEMGTSTCCQRETNTVLNIMLTLGEDNKPEAVDAYVFTFDENPFSILPFLCPAGVKDMGEQELEEKEKAYEEWAAEVEAHPEWLYEWVLEPAKSKDRVVLRVIDTFFL